MTREYAIGLLTAIMGHEPYGSSVSTALDMAIAALREQDSLAKKTSDKKTSEWISVEEQLPDKRMDVLIFTWDCDTYIADYIPSVKQWWVENDLRSDVSHWMPMPEPPTEEEV